MATFLTGAGADLKHHRILPRAVHQVVNRSGEDAVVLEIGTRAGEERGHYPDVDLVYEKRGGKIRFTNKAGEAYD